MTGRRIGTLGVGAIGLVLLAVVAPGCGEKLAVPQAVGLFGNRSYQKDGELVLLETPQQVAVIDGLLYVLTPTRLTRRQTTLEELDVVQGFTAAEAICASDDGSLIFVWDAGPRRVTWLRTSSLAAEGSADLPAIPHVSGMATCRAGVELVPGAETYLYLSDPDSAVVHRFAYDPFTGLTPSGILCRSDGQGTRFVHVPGALARDAADSLLVCDRDPDRNWIIRFNATPDLADTSSNPDDIDPARGRAAVFEETCNPPSAADYVLGDAPGCDPTQWDRDNTKAEPGSLNDPRGAAVDGSGAIYVADHFNGRIQIFNADGRYYSEFGKSDALAGPTGIAVHDVYVGSDVPGGYNHGAYVYVITGDVVWRFISNEQYFRDYGEPPPPLD